jgi:hypothetical protein
MSPRRDALTLLAALLLASTAPAARAATFQLVNNDGPGEGFNDPTPVAPVGGNPGTTLGQQRLNVFHAAGTIWGQILPDNVTIVVEASFDPLAPCDGTGGVLGSAGATAQASDFPGALIPNTWYSIALANKLNGSDLDPGGDIVAQFNSDVDNSTCLGGISWYYGYDHNEGSNVDLLAVVLHELGHGLGFETFTDLTTGDFLLNRPDAFARNLFDLATNLPWDQETSTQRRNSAVNPGQLVWNGPTVKANAPRFLGAATIVRIDGPPDVAGLKEFNTAAFGPPLPTPALQGELVLVDDGVGTAADGCEPLQNAAQIAGKIALIERGVCTYTSKVARAQAAGAIAVIIGNDTSGAPPFLSGSDPSITIPAVSITIDDLVMLEDQLTFGNTVTATIGGDPSQLAGADGQGRPRMYAPPALAPGSSVSHWDTPETPNLLMEPFINDDLTGVDLTQHAFADMGWTGSLTAVADGSPAPAAPPRAYAVPNPFSDGTAIHFALQHAGQTTIEIYGVNGALVRRLPAAWRPQGIQAVAWDGHDARGRRAPAGIYFWRVHERDAGETLSGTMVRVN